MRGSFRAMLLGLIWASAAVGAPAEPGGTLSGMAAECQRLAAQPEPGIVGIAYSKIDPALAIPACRTAVRENPHSLEMVAYLARALNKAGHDDEMFRLLWSHRDKGSSLIQLRIGLAYESGDGVAKDEAEAMRWYRLAADQGRAVAQNNLGVMYDNGRGSAKDPAEAARWYRLAADQGYAAAQSNLGVMYDNGTGVAKDPVEAVRWYRLAADQGDASAQSNLGIMYRDGRGVAKDEAQAIRWYRLAADQGHASAQVNLGWMYENGKGVARDWVEAVRQYRLAAGQGNAQGQNNLGVMYSQGNGVVEDEVEAVRLYRLAADQGNARAQVNLGLKYEAGTGVPRDYAEAVRWYRRAADQGDALGQAYLGTMYRTGRGVAKSEVEAVRLYRLSAAQGHSEGQFQLGYAYSEGLGVPRDDRLAAYWYGKSAEQGGKAAAGNMGSRLVRGSLAGRDCAEGVRLIKASATSEPWAQNYLGTLYRDGRCVEQNLAEAVRLFRLAADKGQTIARDNLADMYRQGIFVEKDEVEAERLYRLAAASAWGNAQHHLALFYERGGGGLKVDPALAVDWHLKAALGGIDASKERLSRAVGDAADALHAPLASRVAELIRLAVSYEDVKLDCYEVIADCGEGVSQRIDLEQAARLYRLAVAGGSREAGLRLGRLLVGHPELAQRPGEGMAVLEAASAKDDGLIFDDAARFLIAVQRRGDPPGEASMASDPLVALLEGMEPVVASQIAFNAVIGRYGDAGVAPAYHYLEAASARKSPLATEAFLSAFLFYGGLDRAADELARATTVDWTQFAGWDYSIGHQLDLWLAQTSPAFIPDADRRKALRRLLTVAGEKGNSTAGGMIFKLDEVERRIAGQTAAMPAIAAIDPKVARDHARRIEERLHEKRALGGLSPLHVSLLQELSLAQEFAGRPDKAVEATLAGLAISLQINDASRHLKGGLVHALDESCFFQKASGRLQDLKRQQMAGVLAIEAFNALQQARGRLAGLPEGLQGCFRDTVSDQYRVIAELFIRQGRFAQAERVLEQLKDFERYEFASRDAGTKGQGFARETQGAAESKAVGAIRALPYIDRLRLARRFEELTLLEKPTAAEEREFASVKRQLEAEEQRLEQGLSEIGRAVAAVETGRTRKRGLDDLTTMSGQNALRAALGELPQNAASIYNVVLADRTHFIVTTRDSTEHVEIAIGEAELNKMIGDLRIALQDYTRDPKPLAMALYDRIWAPVEALLDRQKVDIGLLSMDAQLRYLPIAALHDGTDFLLRKRPYAVLTADSRRYGWAGTRSLSQGFVEALGASQGGNGFSALPAVGDELNVVVRDGDGDQLGAMSGRVRLDPAFTERSLLQALLTPTPTPAGAKIVHIATHFDLKPSDEQSRILLGDGSLMNVAAFRKAVGGHVGKVSLFVLSACETGLGDGDEVESFASLIQGNGSGAVLATLWKVVDVSTALFMDSYYGWLAKGKGRSEALQLAQLDLVSGRAQTELATRLKAVRAAESGAPADDRPGLDAYPGFSHPRFWAPFVLMGQWN